MIVRMKKANILVLDKFRQESLLALRKFGLLHIKHMKLPASANIDSIEKKIQDTERALWIISEYPVVKERIPDADEDKMCLDIQQVISLAKRREAYSKNKHHIEEKISWYKEWGEFSVSDLKALAEQGIHIRLYRCSKKAFLKLLQTEAVQVVKIFRRIYNIAVISFNQKHDLGIQEITLPDRDFESLSHLLADLDTELLSIDKKLAKAAKFNISWRSYLKQLKKVLDFHKAESGMYDEGVISCLQGFIPENESKRLVDLAKRKGWAYLIQEPDDPAQVPTLIKNPAWIRIINPVFKFMSTVPGYKEYDISLSFLLFFSLFFAMIIGDAGYGALFLITTFALRKKMPDVSPEPFMLMYVLSFATLIWGAISGTWFGFEQVARLPFLRSLIIPSLYSFNDGNQMFLMYICFIIGVLHLTLAHATAAIRIINSLKALAQLGWICIVWGIFFLVGMLVVDKPLPFFTNHLLIAGVALVVFFSNPQKNILKGALISLGELPLKLIGSFGDTLSYLRLFAVGVVSVMVATSFNEMALEIGFSSVISSLGAAIVLFLGHALNIVLGLMSVLVHGVRLNMLEFSGHLDMEWSGTEYDPFKE